MAATFEVRFYMVLTSGLVVGSKIVVDGDPLPEGTRVTVLTREGGETFSLDAAAEAELLASIAEADPGDLGPATEVLKTLRTRE